jgi:hypothetical protein
MDLQRPDEIITPADLESLALEYLRPLPIPGVEGRTLDPDDGWATVLLLRFLPVSLSITADREPCTTFSRLIWLSDVVQGEMEPPPSVAKNGGYGRS